MRGSIKIFTWLGIPVYLHWTFSLVLIYLLYYGIAEGMGIGGFLLQIGLFAALFGCVLLHEYGHSIMARRYQVQTQDIILTPIGGIARLERMPEKPKQEFLVAIAGPLVNVAIAVVVLLATRLAFSGDSLDWAMFRSIVLDWIDSFVTTFINLDQEDRTTLLMEETGTEPSTLVISLASLLSVNIVMVLFNLIPAFPMDGGRIFRSLLASQIGRVKATRIASIAGQVIAALFVINGLLRQEFMLTLIGFFVFTTARQENSMVQLDDQLKNFRASDILRRQFTSLHMNDWMQTPISLLHQSLERHFLVFDFNNTLVGWLSEADIVEASKRRDLAVEIARYARQNVELVNINESLRYIHFLIRTQGIPLLGVVDNEGILVGVIDEQGMNNFLRLQ